MKEFNAKEHIDNITFLPCACGNASHHLIFIKFPEDREVYTYVMIDSHYPWYKRIWLGIKYVFNMGCRYGLYDELLINRNNVHILQSVCDSIYHFEKEHEVELENLDHEGVPC
jgi:hypothetical protein